MTDSYEVYLVLQRFRDSVDQYRRRVRALNKVGPEYLPSAEVFYRPSTDTALLVLHFSPYAVMHLGEDSIHLLAHRSRLPMIVPAQLETEQQRSFFLEQLSCYEVYIPPGPADHASLPPAEYVVELLASRVSGMSDVSVLPRAEQPQELPLFRPWWERPSTSDLPGC